MTPELLTEIHLMHNCLIVIALCSFVIAICAVWHVAAPAGKEGNNG